MRRAPGINIPVLNMAPSLYFTYRDETRTFADVSLWRSMTTVITGRGEPEELPALFVTHRFLPMLGVQPALGRGLSEQDERPNGPLTVILSHGYWISRFGGDPSAVRTTERLLRENIQIVEAEMEIRPRLERTRKIDLPE